MKQRDIGREREGGEGERDGREGVRNINTYTCTSYCCLYCIGCL